MKCWLLSILLLLCTPMVCADVIGDINLWIGEDGFTWIEQRIVFDSEGEYGSVTLPSFINEVTSNDDNGRLINNISEVDGVRKVKVFFPRYLEAGETKQVWLKYGTHHITTKEEGVWRINYQTQATPRTTIVRVTYPVGSQVLTLRPDDLLRTYVKNGIWIYPQEAELNFSSTYKYGGVKPVETTTTTTLPKEEPFKLDTRTFYGLILGVVVLAVAVIVLVLYRNRLLVFSGPRDSMRVTVNEDVVSEPKAVGGKVSYDIEGSEPYVAKSIKDSIIKMLDDNELAIVKLLENSEEDEVTQAYLYKTTGIPKSSLSDILRRIEKRNIIERRVEGRVKWIKLKSWVLE
jgi:uncharacterized membrane protein